MFLFHTLIDSILICNSFVCSTSRLWNALPEETKQDEIGKFKACLKPDPNNKIKPRFYSGTRRGQILHTRLRSGNCDLNQHLHSINLSDTPNCTCGAIETIQHYLLHCPNHQEPRTSLTTKIHRLGIAKIDTKLLLEGKDDILRKRQISNYLTLPKATVYHLTCNHCVFLYCYA